MKGYISVIYEVLEGLGGGVTIVIPYHAVAKGLLHCSNRCPSSAYGA